MSDTRERIVKKTAELLMRQGYHGTGLNQIVQESETPRGSLYYYFPGGKEELAAEAVRYRGQRLVAGASAELAKKAHPKEAICQLIRVMIDDLVQRNYTTGAPLAGMAMEASTTSEVLREACQEVYDNAQAMFAAKLREAYDTELADSLAQAILAALEGALVMAYTQGSEAPLAAVAVMVQTCLPE